MATSSLANPNTHHRVNNVMPRNWRATDDSSNINSVPVMSSPGAAVVAPQRTSGRIIPRTSMGMSKSDSDPLSRGPVSRPAIDLCFRDAGYTPISSTAIYNHTGALERVLIEALNPMGTSVIIETDTDDSNIGSKHRASSASSNPFSTAFKDRHLELSQPDTRGIAIVCSDKMCTVIENGSSCDERSATLMSNARPQTSKILNERTMRAIPVVKLDDIIVNKDAVLKGTEKATARIVNDVMNECSHTLESVDADYANMHRELKRFYSNMDSVMDYMRSESDDIRHELDRTTRSLPLDQKERNERHEMVMKMKDIEDMHFETLRLCDRLSEEVSRKMREITDSVREINNTVTRSMNALSI